MAGVDWGLQTVTTWARSSSSITRHISASDSRLQELYSSFRPIITRGSLRSYGDAPLLTGGYSLLLANQTQPCLLSENTVRVSAASTIGDLSLFLKRHQLALPVVPGTARVTVGGAIASDVHGKNHPHAGSFGNHVSQLKLFTPKYGPLLLTPDHTDQFLRSLFWATIGGMGLTGTITEAVLSLVPLRDYSQRTVKFDSLSALVENWDDLTHSYTHNSAWIDFHSLSFSGLLHSARPINCLSAKSSRSKKSSSQHRPPLLRVSHTATHYSFNILSSQVNSYCFNKLVWLRYFGKLQALSLVTDAQVNHPLDRLHYWNRLFGRSGLLQLQISLPTQASSYLVKMLEMVKAASLFSPLVVLKRFSSGNNSFLSFPSPGFTLAVDLPACSQSEAMTRLVYDEVIALGGCVYLAKDKLLKPYQFLQMYKDFPEWLRIKRMADPGLIYQSDLFRRISNWQASGQSLPD